MKKLNIWFTDFSEDFDVRNNFFYNQLSNEYDIILNKSNPDFLIYSCYGENFINYNCVRIFYTGENLRPDFNLCDYGIGFDHLNFGDRYLRYPNFVLFDEQFKELSNRNAIDLENIKKRLYFCNFIYSNSTADPTRDLFYHKLSKYKKISSPGRHLNNSSMNVGDRFSNDWMYSKTEFQKNSKFTIAFENSSTPGYTTEKIMHALLCQTIPIYWGNPNVEADFNPEAFINCHDYNNFDEILEKVIELDNDDSKFLNIVNKPVFKNNTVPFNLETKTIINFLKHIFEQEPINALRRPLYGTTLKYESNRRNNLKIVDKFKRVRKLFPKF